MLLFVAIAIFTPLYSYQQMIIILSIFCIWLVSSLVIDKHWVKMAINPLFLLCLIVLLDYILGTFHHDTTATLLGINKMPTFVWIIVLIFYTYHMKLVEELIPIIVILMIISAIYTIIGNIEYPSASRLLASTGDDYYTETRSLYRELNIGGYGYIYSLVFAILPLGLISKKSSFFIKIFYITSIVLFFITIVLGAYMIGILLVCTMLILLFVNPEKIKITTIFTLFLCLFLLRFVFLDILVSVGEQYDITALSKHAEELLSGTYSAGDKYNSRIHIYYNAILNWLDSPICGQLFGHVSSEYRRAGHSQLLDFLEKYGLFAYVYVMFLKYLYKFVMNGIRINLMKKYYKLYYIVMIVFMFINRFDTFMALGFMFFFFGPILIKSADRRTLLQENINI